MLVEKTNGSSVSGGCLSFLKPYVTIEIPPNKRWDVTDGSYLIGYPTGFHDTYTTPFKTPPSYIIFRTKGYLIRPTAYSLEGRRNYDFNMLKSWSFDGLLDSGVWKQLHKEDDDVFKQGEIRSFSIKSENFFKAFRVNMTDTDSSGLWALCLGQIEIFGFVLSLHSLKINHKTHLMISQFLFAGVLFDGSF